MRVVSFLAVVLLVAAACSGGEEKDPPSSLTPVTRSIAGIVPAADIGEGGQPVDPGFTFPPDAPKITVVVQAGEVTGSPMDLTWFQVTGEGEKELFRHTVEVASFEAAYSVGDSPGTLTPGAYRVEATFEGETGSTRFAVEAPEVEASTAGTVAPAAGATGQGATSGPPTSGDSGAVATPASDPPPSGEAYAEFSVIEAPVDVGPPGILFTFTAAKPGGGATVEAQAIMGENMRVLSYPLTRQQDAMSKTVNFDPCVHPGGSDLPGTKASFDVSVVESDNRIYAGGIEFTTLGPDETRPETTLNSEPPNKSRVEPGKEILLDATARESRDGPTWQEGLRSFKLVANPGGLVGEEQKSDSPVAQPCGRKQWSLATQATYHVPGATRFAQHQFEIVPRL